MDFVTGAPARRSPWRGLLWALPFLLMAAVVMADLLTGPNIEFLPLLSLGPALAAASWRPPHTALIGVLALALCAGLVLYDSTQGHRRVLIAVLTVCGATVAGVIASAARHRRERELAGVRAVAEAAQQVVLRPVPPDVGTARLAVRYISATAAARIGGDLYEVITACGGVRLILGDAQGKGLPAVQTAAAVLGAFREAAYDAADLPEISRRVERSLERQAADEEFVTAVLAQIPPGGQRIEILNCGHPPPLLLTAGTARFIEPPEASLPLGLAPLAATARIPVTVPFGPGDQMLFYTDGVSEARDRAGEFYPLGRCPALLAGDDPGAVLERLQGDVVRHVGHALLDDAAMLLIRHPGSVRAAAGPDGDTAAPGPTTEVRVPLRSRSGPADPDPPDVRPGLQEVPGDGLARGKSVQVDHRSLGERIPLVRLAAQLGGRRHAARFGVRGQYRLLGPEVALELRQQVPDGRGELGR